MSEVRFCLDENIDGATARGLRTRGIDVLTTPEAGHIGLGNREYLEFARAQGRVIVTKDDDFLRLHSEGLPHAGIVYYRPGSRTIKQVLNLLILLHGTMTPQAMAGYAEFI